MPVKKLLAEKVTQLKGHQQPIYTIVPAVENHQIYTGSGDNLVTAWDLDQMDFEKVLVKVPATVYALHPVYERDLFLVGHREGAIHVIDLAQKKEVKCLQFHKAPIFDIKSSLKQNRFFVVAGDGKLTAWSLEDFTLLHEVQLCKDDNIRFMDFDPSGSEMAVACSDNTVRIIDVGNFQQKAVLKSHERSVFCSCYHPNGKYLLTGSLDARLNVWNIDKNYELCLRIPAHYFTINSIVFSPDNRLFATGSRDRTIKIWDAEGFELLKVINYEKHAGHRFSVNRLYWSNYNDYLISGSDDCSLMVWKISTINQN